MQTLPASDDVVEVNVDCVNDRESLDCEADEPSDADDGVLESVDSSTVVHILYVM